MGKALLRIGVAAAALFLVPPAVLGQGNAELEFAGVDFSAKRDEQGFLKVGFRTNLPSDTRVVFELYFEGDPIPELWGARYFSESAGGQGEIWVGPLTKRLLPGSYEFTIFVDPAEQNPAHQAFWSQIPERIERRLAEHWGDPGLEASLRAALREEILEAVEPVQGLVEEVLQVEKDYKKREKFFKGERFQAPEFVEWAETVRRAAESVKVYYDTKTFDTYGTYFARAYRETLPIVWMHARVACIDDTVDSIFEKEGLSIPEGFERLQLPMPIPRGEAIQILETSLRDLDQILGKAPPSPPLSDCVPGEKDLPVGWHVGPIPKDLAAALKSNPEAENPLTQDAADRWTPYTGGTVFPPGMKVQGAAFCLTPRPPDGEEWRETGQWVLVIFTKFPGAVIPRDSAPEDGATPSPGAAEAWGPGPSTGPGGTVLAGIDTYVALHAAMDAGSREALDDVREWLEQRFAFRLLSSEPR